MICRPSRTSSCQPYPSRVEGDERTGGSAGWPALPRIPPDSRPSDKCHPPYSRFRRHRWCPRRMGSPPWRRGFPTPPNSPRRTRIVCWNLVPEERRLEPGRLEQVSADVLLIPFAAHPLHHRRQEREAGIGVPEFGSGSRLPRCPFHAFDEPLPRRVVDGYPLLDQPRHMSREVVDGGRPLVGGKGSKVPL